MIITRTSEITGKVHSLDIPVTQEQLDAWESGELIQRAMPNLKPHEREFILSGITEDEWKEHLQSDDEEDDFYEGNEFIDDSIENPQYPEDEWRDF